jgi:hypothetical protein
MVRNDFNDIIEFFAQNERPEIPRDKDVLEEGLINQFKDFKYRFVDDGSRIEISQELNSDLLRSLFNNELSAIHIKKFVSEEVCNKLGGNLKDNFNSAKWEDTDMFQGYGFPVNRMFGPTVDDSINYFKQVIPTIRKIRNICDGVSPVDKLRLELDELWSNGCRIGAINPFNRKMFVGLTRLMTPQGLVGKATRVNGLIHIDTSLHTENAVEGLFSSNIYLDSPKEGGELCIWNVTKSEVFSAEFDYLNKLLDSAFSKKYREEIQEILQNILPEPILIKPEKGDLVILNSGRPHAVRGFEEGVRISMQTFISYGADTTLQLFS